MPGLLKPVDKIDFGRLKLELTRLSRQESSWGDKMVTRVTWPTVMGIMLIIVTASLSWWKKRQVKMLGVKVKSAESASAVCIECPIGAPYQDRLDHDAVEPIASMEKQPTVAVRDLEPEKGLLRLVVKTRPSRKTRV